MNRFGIAGLAAVALLLGGCVNPPSPPPPATQSAPQPTSPSGSAVGVLTAASPSARIPVVPVRDARQVRLLIISMANSSRQGIVLRISLARGSDKPVVVGTVGPFPADQPGDLSVQLDPAASELAAGPDPVVLIELSPVGAEPLRDDVRVSVTASLKTA